MRWLAAVVVSLLAVGGAPGAAHAESGWSPPVDAPVSDPFRPPPHPYGPGNRGLEYATEPGTPVRAVGDGEVVFAGGVAGTRHVVVLHPNGLRSSYSFLASVDVARGDEVHRGEVVGTAGVQLHLGVRAGDRYLDPAPLVAGAPPRVRLVPVRGSEAEERNAVLDLLGALAGGAFDATAAGVGWARGVAGLVVEERLAALRTRLLQLELAVQYVTFPFQIARQVERARFLLDSQAGCTPAGVPPPPPPPGRRIAILVGGLGSTSGDAAVLDVDTRALGYADGDVAQFSYRGGQAGGRRRLDGVPVRAYDSADTAGDIDESAARFADFVDAVRRAHPGVPVDVIAHSLGGLVVREAEVGDRVEHVVTLGTPHHGADLASTAAALAATDAGSYVVGLLELAGIPAGSKAVEQLRQGSPFIEGLPPPPDQLTSIGARTDVVVPVLQSTVEGATNAVVALGDDLNAHDALPGSPEAARELALALGGRGPTCRGLDSLTVDVVVAAGISHLEDVQAAGLLGLGLYADRRIERAQERLVERLDEMTRREG